MSSSRTTALRVVNEVPEDHIALIERLANDKEDYEAAKKVIKDYEATLKGLVKIYAEGVDSDTISQVLAENHLLEIGAAGNKKQIKSLPRLIQILTPQVFLEICKVNIGDIEKYVPAHQLDEVIEVVPSETRSTAIIKRAA